MANSQLTAYVSGQLDKGVSREAITQALIGAGWVQADVDAAVTEVMGQRSGTMNVAVTPGIAGANPTVVVSQTQPSTIASPDPVTTTITATTTPATSAASTVTPASFFATTPATSTFDAAATAPKKSLTWLFVLVGILLALGIIGGVAYALFMGDNAADDTTATQATTTQDMATAQQESDQLRTEVSTLSDNVSELQNELSIFQATTTVAVPLTIKGTLTTTTANAWILTTVNNIVLTVSNAKDPNLAAQLAPVRGAVVELTGTHAAGSTLLKVTAVNGVAVATTAAATTTTAMPQTGALPASTLSR